MQRRNRPQHLYAHEKPLCGRQDYATQLFLTSGIIKNLNSKWYRSTRNSDLAIIKSQRSLFYGDVFVDILTSHSSIEEYISQHGDNQPVAAHVANALGNGVLDERHDTSTNHHGHKDS